MHSHLCLEAVTLRVAHTCPDTVMFHETRMCWHPNSDSVVITADADKPADGDGQASFFDTAQSPTPLTFPADVEQEEEGELKFRRTVVFMWPGPWAHCSVCSGWQSLVARCVGLHLVQHLCREFELFGHVDLSIAVTCGWGCSRSTPRTPPSRTSLGVRLAVTSLCGQLCSAVASH